MMDEPVAPVSGKESAHKMDASLSDKFSSENMPN